MDWGTLVVTAGLGIMLALGVLAVRLLTRDTRHGLQHWETDFDRAARRAASREDLGRLQ